MSRNHPTTTMSRLVGCWALALTLALGCAHRPPELTWQLRRRYHYSGSLADLERDAARALGSLDVDVVGVSPHRLAIRPHGTDEAEVQLRLQDGILHAQNMVADHDSIEQSELGREILRRVRELPGVGGPMTSEEARSARTRGVTAPAPDAGTVTSTPPSPEPGRATGRRRRRPRH